MSDALEYMAERLAAGALFVDDEARGEAWVVDAEFRFCALASLDDFAVADALVASGRGVWRDVGRGVVALTLASHAPALAGRSLRLWRDRSGARGRYRLLAAYSPAAVAEGGVL